MTKVEAILEKAGGGSAQTIVEALGVYAGEDFSGMTIEEAIRELPEGGGGGGSNNPGVLVNIDNSHEEWTGGQYAITDDPSKVNTEDLTGFQVLGSFGGGNSSLIIPAGMYFMAASMMMVPEFSITDPDENVTYSTRISTQAGNWNYWQVPDDHAGSWDDGYTLKPYIAQ